MITNRLTGLVMESSLTYSRREIVGQQVTQVRALDALTCLEIDNAMQDSIDVLVNVTTTSTSYSTQRWLDDL